VLRSSNEPSERRRLGAGSVASSAAPRDLLSIAHFFAFFLALASAVRFFAAALEALSALARRCFAVRALARAKPPELANSRLTFLMRSSSILEILPQLHGESMVKTRNKPRRKGTLRAGVTISVLARSTRPRRPRNFRFDTAGVRDAIIKPGGPALRSSLTCRLQGETFKAGRWSSTSRRHNGPGSSAWSGLSRAETEND
jgi:hypothetical protein